MKNIFLITWETVCQ